MSLREAMETSSAGTGSGRKKLKHRLAAILSVFSRRGGGGSRKRRESEAEAEATPSPALAFPSYCSRVGSGKKQHEQRRFSVSAPRAPPLVHITIDCAGRRSVDAADPSLLPLPLDADRRLTETGRLYETGGEWEGRKCPPSSPFVAHHLPPLPPVARWRERSSSRRLSTHSSSRGRLGASSSSSDDEDSRRNLFSSRSFSSDSSDFYNCGPRKSSSSTTRQAARASISGPCSRAPPAAAARRGASQSCRYSFEQPRGSTASEGGGGGFAVVKRSADPYEDFRKSMQEMIAEWPAGEEGEEEEHSAERLLETYLVLNSPRHYPAILAAFADVREALFP